MMKVANATRRKGLRQEKKAKGIPKLREAIGKRTRFLKIQIVTSPKKG